MKDFRLLSILYVIVSLVGVGLVYMAWAWPGRPSGLFQGDNVWVLGLAGVCVFNIAGAIESWMWRTQRTRLQKILVWGPLVLILAFIAFASGGFGLLL
jgi:hypothetical protein